MSNAASGWHSYRNSTYNYSLDIPSAAYLPNKSETGSQIFFGNIPFIAKEAKEGEFDVLIYGEQQSQCSPGITGATKMTPLAISNGKAVWGRADVWELGRREGYVAPFDTSNMKCGAGNNVYAFCSQKDEITVVICINQMTDNPQLAEDIFKTFKWTE